MKGSKGAPKPPARPPLAAQPCPKCGERHALTLADGTPRCQKHSKQRKNAQGRGAQCARAVRPGRDCCVSHGGKSPQGAAAAPFVHGRYSRLLPVRLLDAYESARRDPNLLSLRRQIAVAEARLQDLVTKLPTGDVANLAAQVTAAAAVIEAAARQPDPDHLTAAAKTLKQAAAQVTAEDHVWTEYRRWQEILRRLVDTERRRLEAMQEYVTTERLTTLIAALIEILRKHLGERHRPTLSHIISDITNLVREDHHRPVIDADMEG